MSLFFYNFGCKKCQNHRGAARHANKKPYHTIEENIFWKQFNSNKLNQRNTPNMNIYSVLSPIAVIHSSQYSLGIYCQFFWKVNGYTEKLFGGESNSFTAALCEKCYTGVYLGLYFPVCIILVCIFPSVLSWSVLSRD